MSESARSRTAHEDDADCRNCGMSSLDCWAYSARNALWCCLDCDHAPGGKR